MKSVAYLCCPVQTKEGWAFITALTTFLKGDVEELGKRRLLPARKLDFNDPLTASIFKEIHNLGNWVVNYDELLDRRQLLNQNVKVIRYKQCATQGRNILISSTASLRGAPGGTAYYASKFALRGMTECWRAELRKHNIRVLLINPSEVITNFGAASGFTTKDNPSKLRPEDIAHMVKAVLEMNDRGFTPELSVFATNPVD